MRRVDPGVRAFFDLRMEFRFGLRFPLLGGPESSSRFQG